MLQRLAARPVQRAVQSAIILRRTTPCCRRRRQHCCIVQRLWSPLSTDAKVAQPGKAEFDAATIYKPLSNGRRPHHNTFKTRSRYWLQLALCRSAAFEDRQQWYMFADWADMLIACPLCLLCNWLLLSIAALQRQHFVCETLRPPCMGVTVLHSEYLICSSASGLHVIS